MTITELYTEFEFEGREDVRFDLSFGKDAQVSFLSVLSQFFVTRFFFLNRKQRIKEIKMFLIILITAGANPP